MYDEIFKKYVTSIKNVTTNKLNKTEYYKKITLKFYQDTLFSKCKSNRKLVQNIAQFLQYIYYHKRVGYKRIMDYINNLEGAYYGRL